MTWRRILACAGPLGAVVIFAALFLFTARTSRPISERGAELCRVNMVLALGNVFVGYLGVRRQRAGRWMYLVPLAAGVLFYVHNWVIYSL